MIMFAIGNLVLKYKRPKLPRDIRTKWYAIVLGMSAMLSGLIGNLVLNPSALGYFALYFIIPMLLITMMFQRIRLLKVLYILVKNIPIIKIFWPKILETIKKVKKFSVVFFTKTDDIVKLNKAVLYCYTNEHIDCIKFVHFYDNEDNIPLHLEENHYIIDHMYPKVQIDLLLIKGKFCPDTVRALSEKLKIPLGFMFIQCPGVLFPYKIGEFGGIRTIMN